MVGEETQRKGAKRREKVWGEGLLGWGSIHPSVMGGWGYTHTLYLPDHWDVTGT